MAGSYDPAFHQSGSSNSSGPSPAVNPGQYKANVNRTKTRKWVEAKTIDYGGDDWGADYEYEPAEEAEETLQSAAPGASRFATSPPSASTPEPQHPALTGPRPLQTPSLRFNRSIPPSVSPGAGPRTQGPPLHIQTQPNSPANQQTQTPTDASSPWTSDPHSRRGTPVIDIPVFERGFGGPRILAVSHNKEPVQPRFPHRKSSLSQADAPDTESFATPLGGPTPFGELGEGPQLGNPTRPTIISRLDSSQTRVATVTAPNKPQADTGSERARSSSPGAGSAKSPVNQGKTLPFVRPADIYRKVADEKDRVRRSQDSGRPSIDGIQRGSDIGPPKKVYNASAQQATQLQVHDQSQTKPMSIESAASGNEGSDLFPPRTKKAHGETAGIPKTGSRETGEENSSSSRPGPSLATVTERKSEYGIEGLIASYERRGGTPTTPTFDPSYLLAGKSLPPVSPEVAPAVPEKDSKYKAVPQGQEEKTGGDFSGSAHFGPEISGVGTSVVHGEKERPEDELQRLQEELRRLSTSPKLPELGRLSGFGLDLFNSSSAASNPTSSPSTSAPLQVPVSTVVESPTPVLNNSQDGEMVEAVEGQMSGWSESIRKSEPTFDTTSGTHSPTTRPSDTGDASTDSDHPTDADRDLDRQPAPIFPAESSSQPLPGSQAHEENLPVLQNQPGQPSKSENELSGRPTYGVAEPAATPSGDSLMTQPDSQVSQLVISGPILSTGTPGDSESTTYFDDPDGKLAVPEELQQAKESYSTLNKISAGEVEEASHADRVPLAQAPGTEAAQSAESAGSAKSELTPGNGYNPGEPSEVGATVPEYQHAVTETRSSSPLNESSRVIPSSSAVDETDERETEASTPLEVDMAQQTFHGDASQETITPAADQPVTPAPVDDPARPSMVTDRMVSSTISETGSTASLKDTDKLSEEILRSFDAARPTDSVEKTADADDGANHTSTSPAVARESSFLPDLYDDYWSFAGSGAAGAAGAFGASEEHQKVPDLPHYTPSVTIPEALKVKAEDLLPDSVLFAKDDPVPVIAAARQPDTRTPSMEESPQSQAAPGNPEVHRPNISTRFSWEATPPIEPKSFVGPPKQPTPRPDVPGGAAQALPSLPVHSNSSATEVRPEHPAGLDENSVRRNHGEDTSCDGSNDKIPVVDEQSSEMNTPQMSRGPLPPSSLDSTQSSLASPQSSVPGNNPHKPAAMQDPGSAGGPLLNNPLDSHAVQTFREIMNNPSQLERIQQFNKARRHYATTDIGLHTVLEHLAPMHPDILVQAGRGLGGASQPYVQQLTRHAAHDLGAMPTPAPQASVRPHVPPNVHAAASQVSTKTKELTKDFLHGAGKASRGFFSTLKSKSSKRVPN